LRNSRPLGDKLNAPAMLLFRFAIFFLLLAAGVCFALYIATSKPHYKRWGIMVLKWTLIAALGFFGVLILERLL
jgi:hypothetical protein